MKKYEATLIAPISLLIPIFGILSANMIFNEDIGFYKIIATIFILLGIYVLVFGIKTKEKLLKLISK
jgi:O-acetylserine/cysteine efflux transporter